MITRIAFAASFIFALATIVAEPLHANPSIIGGCIAAFFFSLTLAAGSIARSLQASNTLSEPRHAHGPTELAPLPADVLPRTELFGKFWFLAIGACTLIGIGPLFALYRPAPKRTSPWKSGVRLVTPDGKALRPDDLEIGSIETVFPQHAIDAPGSAVVLLRVDQQTLELPGDHASWVVQGNIAFSKICTHAGCPVALYRRASCELACPCHQSVFDVRHGAKPVSGPAPRALPQLPLATDSDGYLIAASDFREPIGPDAWNESA